MKRQEANDIASFSYEQDVLKYLAAQHNNRQYPRGVHRFPVRDLPGNKKTGGYKDRYRDEHHDVLGTEVLEFIHEFILHRQGAKPTPKPGNETETALLFSLIQSLLHSVLHDLNY